MVRRKYRSQAGIILDILETLEREGPMPATRLATKANLPYDRLKVALASMEAEGLVDQDDDRRYHITPKGLEALQTLRRARNLIESLGFRL